MSCIFCQKDKFNKVLENKKAFAIYDKYPVNKGHMLIIPRRHYSDFFESTSAELKGLYDLLVKAKEILNEEYNPDGFNIGINNGQAAGQTVMHLHIHIIPRYKGDVEDPRGGIRHLKEELVPYRG
ncbi:MAG: HIT family protein [Bacillota bacterium]